MWFVFGCLVIFMVIDYEVMGCLVMFIINDFGVYLILIVVVGLDGIDCSLLVVYGMGIVVGDVNGDLCSDYFFIFVKDDVLWIYEGL